MALRSSTLSGRLSRLESRIVQPASQPDNSRFGRLLLPWFGRFPFAVARARHFATHMLADAIVRMILCGMAVVVVVTAPIVGQEDGTRSVTDDTTRSVESLCGEPSVRHHPPSCKGVYSTDI